MPIAVCNTQNQYIYTHYIEAYALYIYISLFTFIRQSVAHEKPLQYYEKQSSSSFFLSSSSLSQQRNEILFFQGILAVYFLARTGWGIFFFVFLSYYFLTVDMWFGHLVINFLVVFLCVFFTFTVLLKSKLAAF